MGGLRILCCGDLALPSRSPSLSQAREKSDHARRNCDLRLCPSEDTWVVVDVELLVESVSEGNCADGGRLTEEQKWLRLSFVEENLVLRLSVDRLCLCPQL